MPSALSEHVSPSPFAPMSQTVFFSALWPLDPDHETVQNVQPFTFAALPSCPQPFLTSTLSMLCLNWNSWPKFQPPWSKKTSSLPACPSPEPWPWPHRRSPFLCCFNFALDTIYIYIKWTADSCVWIEFRVCDWNGLCLFIHFFWSSSSWYAFYFEVWFWLILSIENINKLSLR